MQSFSSPGHIAELIDSLPQSDDAIRAAAAARQDQLTKPPGSLGQLEKLASGWQNGSRPTGLKSKMANVLSLPEITAW